MGIRWHKLANDSVGFVVILEFIVDRISMVIPGLAFRSAAMCFLACSAYCWPGPGSSVAMRLMAAWASEKIVT